MPALRTDMSIQEALDVRDDRYIQLVLGRAYGQDDAEIARRVGVASPRDLYERIKEDGHPICPKCGKTYVDETHCEPHSETPRKRGKPKAKTFGERTPLPPSEAAIPLFRSTLELLTKELEKLRGFEEEYLQGRRFGGISVREGKKRAWGALATPPEPLTTLIAIEALISGWARSPAITRLIAVLHWAGTVEEHEPFRGGTLKIQKPAPGVNIDDLNKQIKELRECAARVARLVRGWEHTGTRPPGEVSPREHSVLPLVKQRAAEGVSDEEIREEVNRRLDRGPLTARGPESDDFTLKEIRYLKDLDFDG